VAEEAGVVAAAVVAPVAPGLRVVLPPRVASPGLPGLMVAVAGAVAEVALAVVPATVPLGPLVPGPRARSTPLTSLLLASKWLFA
jgi:hypothetical protein